MQGKGVVTGMITDSFDNITEPIVSLEAFYGERKKLLDTCLVIFSKEIYEGVLSGFSCTKIAEMSMVNGAVPIYKFTYEGKDIAFYLSAIGSTAASQYCIEANWITGAEKFIMFGSAGSLDKEKTNGKFIIPTHAYRDEGMSYHYAPASDYITVKNHERLAEIFKGCGFPYVKGRVWTTDAMLRETAGQLSLRQKDGCIAVEMEIAGVQSVCDFYDFELYTFLAIGDVLSDTQYNIEGLHSANHDLDKFYIALEIAKRI